MSVAKHESGMKSPGNKVVNKLPDKLLPTRIIDQADIDWDKQTTYLRKKKKNTDQHLFVRDKFFKDLPHWPR